MLGRQASWSASTTTAAGSTTRFGTMRRSMSVAEIVTSAAQKTAAGERVQGEPEVARRRRRREEPSPARPPGTASRSTPGSRGSGRAEAGTRRPGRCRAADLGPAVRAGGTRLRDRSPERQPRGDHVQEASDRERRREGEGCERDVHAGPIGSLGADLKRIRPCRRAEGRVGARARTRRPDRLRHVSSR